MAVHTNSETSFKQYKNKWNRCSERMGRLTTQTKISTTTWKFRKNREIKQKKKFLKIWDDQIKTNNKAKKTSYKKWLASKKLENKIEYKRNTALTKREVRRHTQPFETNLLHIKNRSHIRICHISRTVETYMDLSHIENSWDIYGFVTYREQLRHIWICHILRTVETYMDVTYQEQLRHIWICHISRTVETYMDLSHIENSWDIYGFVTYQEQLKHIWMSHIENSWDIYGSIYSVQNFKTN